MAEDREPPQSAKELLERYAAGERDFRKAHLEDANLRWANLPDADLSSARLDGADLRDTNLYGVNLSDARLIGARLFCARLDDARLRGAQLRGVDLAKAHLGRVDLSGTDLSDTNFNNAYLSHAKLTGAKLTGANLHGANLSSATLGGADFAHAHLSGVDFSGAYLRGANFHGADLRYAVLGVDLRGTDISSADLAGARFSGAILGGTKLLDLDISPLCETQGPIWHYAPSTVDYRSILRSIGSPKLKDFLRRTGMHEVFIERTMDCALSLKTDASKALQSTFISYVDSYDKTRWGPQDETFARRLHGALHRNGVTTFFSPHFVARVSFLYPHRAAERRQRVREGISEHDQMILVCSRASLDQEGVLNELEKVLEREARDGGASYLIPIRLDDHMFTGWKPPNADLAQAVRDRVVADFEGADADETKFNEGLRRLIAALKKPDPPKPVLTT